MAERDHLNLEWTERDAVKAWADLGLKASSSEHPSMDVVRGYFTRILNLVSADDEQPDA